MYLEKKLVKYYKQERDLFIVFKIDYFFNKKKILSIKSKHNTD